MSGRFGNFSAEMLQILCHLRVIGRKTWPQIFPEVLCFRGDVQTDDLEKLTERSESQILLGLPGNKWNKFPKMVIYSE